MSNLFPKSDYNQMIVRAASIRQEEEGTLYETDLAEITLGQRRLYFIKDPANQQYGCLCMHYASEASNNLDKAEARPIAITARCQISDFIDALHNRSEQELTNVLCEIVNQTEKAKKKGKAY